MPRRLRAVLLREFRDALINRYFQVFCRACRCWAERPRLF